jgi:hypothetical protein
MARSFLNIKRVHFEYMALGFVDGTMWVFRFIMFSFSASGRRLRWDEGMM